MNTTFVSVLSALAATCLLMPTISSANATACTPRLIEKHTTFPIRSQLRGHEGIVYFNVIIDESGRATRADLVRSSGYRMLDRAATASVVENWVFDVSTCERNDLAAGHLYAVEYRNDEY